jgi:ribosomal-protein-alanine N-acetyltransferase
VSALRIWRGGTDDAPRLAELHAPVFPDAWPQEAFRSLLSREGVFVVLGARSQTGSAEGFVLMRVVAGEAEVLTLCVAKPARQSGLGGAVLGTAYDLARTMGATEAFLEVGEANAAALALYRRDGFTVVGRRAAYYRHADKPADALVMRKTLNQR